jgi:hypothetical protein
VSKDKRPATKSRPKTEAPKVDKLATADKAVEDGKTAYARAVAGAQASQEHLSQLNAKIGEAQVHADEVREKVEAEEAEKKAKADAKAAAKRAKTQATLGDVDAVDARVAKLEARF